MIPNHRKVGTGYTRTGDVLVWHDGKQLVLTDHSGYHTQSVLRLKYREGISVWRVRTGKVVGV